MSSYTANAKRTALRTGEVSGVPKVPALTYSAPPEFKGQENIWSPEHLFVAAIATCFINTFEAIAEFSKFSFVALEASAEGVLQKGEGGYRFTHVTVRPTLRISDEADRERALRLLEKSEKACLVSRSISSEITLEPTILTTADTGQATGA